MCDHQTDIEEELAIEFTMTHVAAAGEELPCEYEKLVVQWAWCPLTIG